MSDMNSNHDHFFKKTLYSATVTTHNIYIFLSMNSMHNRWTFKVEIFPTANVIPPFESVSLYATKEIHQENAENIYMKFRF